MNIRNICFWGVIAGLFIVPFIPFVVSSSMLFPFITGKGFAFRIIVEIITALYIILAFSDSSYRPKLTPTAKAVLAFTVATLVADIFGVYPFKSLWSNYERMEGFVTIAHLMLYFFVLVGTLKTKEWWDRFWNTSLVASAIMSIYGVLQLAGKITINQGGVRLDATFGNASYLAIYIVFHIFIACLYWVRTSDMVRRMLYSLLIVLQVAILYFTATRGAILGCIGGLLVSAGIIAWKEKENLWLRKIARITIGTIAILVVAFIALRGTSFVTKSPVLSRFASLSVSEVKTQGRYYVWPMAIQGFKDRPLLGWGQENFNYVFNKYYNPEMYNQEQWFDRTHNVVLDWLIAGGLVGFLAYASMFYALYYVLRKRSNLPLTEKSLIVGLSLAYLFHNMFVFDNLISYIYFFSILAYVEYTSSDQRLPVGGDKVMSTETVAYIVAPIVALVCGYAVYAVNIPAIETSRAIISAISPQQNTGGPAKNLEIFKKAFAYNSFGSAEALEQLVPTAVQLANAQQVPDSVKSDFFNFAQEQVIKKAQATPLDARYQLFAGSYLNQRGLFDQAIPFLEKAVEYSPNKSTMYFELASSYLSKGNATKAFDLFTKGYNLQPKAKENKIIYAVASLYTNHNDIAVTLLKELGDDTIMSDDRILRAYIIRGDYQSAAAIVTARITKNNKPEDKLMLADIYARAGNKNQAVLIIQDLIKQYPEFKAQGELYIKSLTK